MAGDKYPSEELLDEIVKDAVTPSLKRIGFRKSALNYHRRHGSVVQVVNIQLSRGSTSSEKTFYVNVGLAFDEICRQRKVAILEKPTECECDERGQRWRLEKLYADTQTSWTVGMAEVNSEANKERLRSRFSQLATELDQVEDVQTYQQHRWSNLFRPTETNALVLYLTGDMDGAWKEVNDLCEHFADRQKINKPQHWIDELGLAKLASRLKS